ncbi:hypothetical protein [Mucilaginibacter sp.]|uniref:hypothetical protein n=1 Tax=Mucilaginibacter sp. TaxID=1882438 RepID=UPI0025F9E1CD|nr:hypothetical protein [Mucilaginibacter sp.]
MLKRLLYICVIFACITLKVSAAAPLIDVNSLKTILKIENRVEREKKIVGYITNSLRLSPEFGLLATKKELNNTLSQLHVENAVAFEYFAESMYQRRLVHMDDAEVAMVKAIKFAGYNHDHYLVYSFLSHLAFIQTEEGNAIDAVTSYGLSKKETLKINDPHLQVQIDVNMSDVYYKNNFYSQSLFYLNQAELLNKKYGSDDVNVNKVIYYNKAENFFRMNKPDSLKVYHDKLLGIKGNIYKLHTYQKRTEYYLAILQYDFKSAINLIKKLQKDTLYQYIDQDQQNLADAYFNGGQPDSAITIINELLAQPLEINHPEIKYHLYKVLGQIAEAKKDHKTAAYNFKLSLEQAEDVVNRLTQVGNISSQIMIDEIEGSYMQKDESYKRERIWLMFAVLGAIFIIILIAMFYRSAKQKRHYEKLLFTAQKKELAFINSHEVRKHLSNIMGIIDVIKTSDNRQKEYELFEDHLFCSATSMDKAIKSISAKLDDHFPEATVSSPKFAPQLPVEEVTPVNETKAYKALKAS